MQELRSEETVENGSENRLLERQLIVGFMHRHSFSKSDIFYFFLFSGRVGIELLVRNNFVGSTRQEIFLLVRVTILCTRLEQDQ